MITLVPFVKTDEGYTVTDEAIRNMFQKMIRDGTVDTVFYDQPLRTDQDFLTFFKSDRNLPVVALYNNQIAGFAWLNGLAQGFAFAHFVFFKEAWGGKAREIGKKILSYWMNLGVDTPVLSTLIGMVPSFNIKAIQFAKQMGFKEIGTIPNLIQHKIGVCLLYYQE